MLLIALTLITLTGVITAGSVINDRAATRAQHSVELASVYLAAVADLQAEQSLKNEYQLRPGSATSAGHQGATVTLRAALEQVRALGSASDRRRVAAVLADQSKYVAATAALFAAVNRHEPRAVTNQLDATTVVPLLAVMQGQIYPGAIAVRKQALANVTQVRRTGRLVVWFDVATLLVGIATLMLAWRALRRSRLALQTQSDLNRHQALHDVLTGLPNRTLFQDRASQALRATQRTDQQVAIMIIDLDRFKDVNDTLGHQFGDLLLQQVAQRFEASLRGGDSVARLGGDEFAVLLPASNAADAHATAERLVETLTEPFDVRDISLDVDASIGIALAATDEDVDAVVRHADVAMYEAKAHHASVVTYSRRRDANTVTRLAVLGDLRRAIPAGEIVLHYQPKISAMTGELHSVEALVRWEHPTSGLLGPAAFMPVVENTAIVHLLTAEVLRLALSQCRAWLDQGRSIPICVNVSARSLLTKSFPQEVRDLLKLHGVPASLLTLEITESSIMSDPPRAYTIMKDLDAMGVTLSVDDYGTGYSSMARLKALPVKELKIDRRFVMGMAIDERDHFLVQSALDLGHNLGLQVVAEGVEDEWTRDALAAMGCDLLQGYYIQVPGTEAELETWLTGHGMEPVPSAVS
ncbi:MAG TPA: EAL domain-containing protein [Mycobacteriales bacterium]|nr:EAL domain-containing protein [Mycobacteriales bacterium]